MRETTRKLEGWATWVRTSPIDDLGYPRYSISCPYVPGEYPEDKHQKRIIISDEEAEEIGLILARLKRKDERMWRAVHTYYLYHCNMSEAARKLKENRNRLEVLVKAGEAWVDGVLSQITC